MITTPLYKEVNGVFVSQVVAGSVVYAIDTNHNLTEGKEYIVSQNAYGDVLIKNDIGNEEWYTNEWFSLTKPIF